MRGALALPGLGLALGLCATDARAVSAAKTLSNDAVQSAARYSRERAELSLIIYQRGRVLLEEYPVGDAGTGNFAASLVKSLWGVAAVAAAQDGLLSLDELVSATFPEWKADPRKARIRVRDLLTMTSGLAPGYEPLYSAAPPEDAYSAALALPALFEPGERFTYGPANMEVFGALLEKKLKRRSLSPLRYLEKRVLEPIGSGYTSWVRDRMGHPMMSSGAQMTARHLLAVGRLLSKRGVWRGRQLLAADKLSSLAQGTEANPAYGLTFWLNVNAARPDSVEVDIERALGQGEQFTGWATACISKVAPPDMLVMLGSWNQRVYVMPSLDLVVVRQGSGAELSDAEFLSRLLK